MMETQDKKPDVSALQAIVSNTSDDYIEIVESGTHTRTWMSYFLHYHTDSAGNYSVL